MAEIFNQSEQLSNSILKKIDLNLELWPVNALRLEWCYESSVDY